MNIYIKNVYFEATQKELFQFLNNFFKIEALHLPLDKQTGKGRGFAFLRVSDNIGIRMIEELNMVKFKGRELTFMENKNMLEAHEKVKNNGAKPVEKSTRQLEKSSRQPKKEYSSMQKPHEKKEFSGIPVIEGPRPWENWGNEEQDDATAPGA